jgi:hypothetical protein
MGKFSIWFNNLIPETEKGFMQKAMDNIALAIGRLEDAKEIHS